MHLSQPHPPSKLNCSVLLLNYSCLNWLLQWSNSLYSTALAYSYQANFHNAYRCLRHAHYWYQPQLPYKSHRTYLTNHMEYISYHITPLVINSLGSGHTRIQKFVNRSNSTKPGWPAPGLKSKRILNALNTASYTPDHCKYVVYYNMDMVHMVQAFPCVDHNTNVRST